MSKESVYENFIKGHRRALLFERFSRGKRFNCSLVTIGGRRGDSVSVTREYHDVYGTVQLAKREEISLASVYCGDSVFIPLDDD